MTYNPLDVIYSQIWLDEKEFTYYEINLVCDNYEQNKYNAIVQETINEWG